MALLLSSGRLHDDLVNGNNSPLRWHMKRMLDGNDIFQPKKADSLLSSKLFYKSSISSMFLLEQKLPPSSSIFLKRRSLSSLYGDQSRDPQVLQGKTLSASVFP